MEKSKLQLRKVKRLFSAFIAWMTLVLPFFSVQAQSEDERCTNGTLEFLTGGRKGCVGMTVQLDDNDDSVPSVIFIETSPGGGFPDNPNNPVTLTEPGSYGIRVVLGTGGAGSNVFECANYIEIVEDEAPQIEVSTCSSNTTAINILSFGNFDFLEIRTGDNTEPNLISSSLGAGFSFTHSYNTPGDYDLTVKGIFAENDQETGCDEVVIPVKVGEVLSPPSIDAVAVLNEGETIQLTISLPFPEARFILQEKVGNGPFQNLMTVTGQDDNSTISLTLTGKSADAVVYAYRITTPSTCGNNSISSATAASSFLTLSSENKENQLNWLPYEGDGFQQYTILRNGQEFRQFTDPSLSGYTDKSVVCLQEYEYQLKITASNSGKETTITMPLKTVTTTSTIPPDPVNNFYASVENETVVLRWENSSSEANSYEAVVEKFGNDTFLEVIRTNGNTFTDTNVSVSDSSYCYNLVIRDDCQNLSEAQKACTMLLTGEKDGRDNRLFWSPFEGFEGNFSYTLEVSTADLGVYDSFGSFPPSETTFLHELSDFPPLLSTYTLQATHLTNPSQVAFSNPVSLIEEIKLTIPDAFSPNGDGLNDRLKFYGSLVKEFEVVIYSRWGNPVYTSKDLNEGWNGTNNGKSLPEGPYSYIVRGTDLNNRPFLQKGTVLLLR